MTLFWNHVLIDSMFLFDVELLTIRYTLALEFKSPPKKYSEQPEYIELLSIESIAHRSFVH